MQRDQFLGLSHAVGTDELPNLEPHSMRRSNQLTTEIEWQNTQIPRLLLDKDIPEVLYLGFRLEDEICELSWRKILNLTKQALLSHGINYTTACEWDTPLQCTGCSCWLRNESILKKNIFLTKPIAAL